MKVAQDDDEDDAVRSFLILLFVLILVPSAGSGVDAEAEAEAEQLAAVRLKSAAWMAPLLRPPLRSEASVAQSLPMTVMATPLWATPLCDVS